MSPHERRVHGRALSDQEEKRTLQRERRLVAGIASSVTTSSLRELVSECWTEFPCNKLAELNPERTQTLRNGEIRTHHTTCIAQAQHRATQHAHTTPKHGEARLNSKTATLICWDFPVSRDRLTHVLSAVHMETCSASVFKVLA